MKYMKQLLVAAVLVLGMLAGGSAQAQTDRSVYHFKGLGGYTLYSSWDGCWYRETYVQAWSNVNHTAGEPPTSEDGAYLSYYNYNYCTGEYAYASGSTDDATVSGTLSELHVSATIPLVEYSTAYPDGRERTASVDLTFDATRDYVERGVQQNSYSTPYERVHSRWVGRTQSADVSGSVTLDDGTDLLAGLTRQYAYVFDSNSGTVTITR